MYFSLETTEQSSLGHPTVFCKGEERTMHMFLIDCIILRIPRTERMFGYDIQDFILREKMTVPFKNGIPG